MTSLSKEDQKNKMEQLLDDLSIQHIRKNKDEFIWRGKGGLKFLEP